MKSCSPGGWLCSSDLQPSSPLWRWSQLKKTCLAQGDTLFWGPILPGPTSARILRSKLPSPAWDWHLMGISDTGGVARGLCWPCIAACIFLWSGSASFFTFSRCYSLQHPLIHLHTHWFPFKTRSSRPHCDKVHHLVPGLKVMLRKMLGSWWMHPSWFFFF